ncbi:MAG: hypothetical protein WC890_07035 [Candidatus Margulisiibacteriota bacterium]
MRKPVVLVLFVTCILLLVSLLSGCSRYVTPVVNYGEQMTVVVTLRGALNVTANRYFLVMSSGSSLAVPLPPPDNPYYYEMIEPGTIPINNSIVDYYNTYYSTWSGYVIADNGGFFTVMGPFVSGEAITRESLANLGDLTTTVRFVVPLNKIFATTPSTIYFDLVTVNWPDGLPKIPVDHLTTTNAYISKISGSYITVEDSEDLSIDSSLDILSCYVEIQ